MEIPGGKSAPSRGVGSLRRIWLASIVHLVAGADAPAHAAHPLLTEDTGTQGLGKVQWELTADRTRDRSPAGGVRDQVAAAVLSYGIREQADLQLGLSHSRRRTHEADGRHASAGVQDVSVDYKWRFFEREALSLGFKPGVTLPSGNGQRGFGAGRATWGVLLILSHEPGPWAFHTHFGYRRNNNALDQRTSLKHFSAALTWQATERFRLVADLSADTNPDRGDRGSLRYRVVGLVFSPTSALDVDVGLKHGHGRAATDRAFLIGATLRW